MRNYLRPPEPFEIYLKPDQVEAAKAIIDHFADKYSPPTLSEARGREQLRQHVIVWEMWFSHTTLSLIYDAGFPAEEFINQMSLILE